MTRPNWAWDVYNAWRKRSTDALGYSFEAAGWFKNGDGWSRQNTNMDRVTVYSGGRVECTHGHVGWL